MKLTEKNLQTNWKYLAIVVVLGLTVGVGTLGYANSLRIEPQTKQIVALRPTPSSTPTEIDTSGWQTYHNDEFGFEVKFPSFYEDDPNAKLCNPQSDNDFIWIGPLRISVEDAEARTLSAFVDSEEQKLHPQYVDIESRKEISIGGNKGEELVISACGAGCTRITSILGLSRFSSNRLGAIALLISIRLI